MYTFGDLIRHVDRLKHHASDLLPISLIELLKLEDLSLDPGVDLTELLDLDVEGVHYHGDRHAVVH